MFEGYVAAQVVIDFLRRRYGRYRANGILWRLGGDCGIRVSRRSERLLHSSVLLGDSFAHTLTVVLELIAGVRNILVIQFFCVLVKTATFVGSVSVRTLCLQCIER